MKRMKELENENRRLKKSGKAVSAQGDGQARIQAVCCEHTDGLPSVFNQ